jgi:hypothetical protein
MTDDYEAPANQESESESDWRLGLAWDIPFCFFLLRAMFDMARCIVSCGENI